jgi:hypothetical protein
MMSVSIETFQNRRPGRVKACLNVGKHSLQQAQLFRRTQLLVILSKFSRTSVLSTIPTSLPRMAPW